MTNIAEIEQEYIRAHSEYVRLLNSSSTTWEELKNTRLKLDELGNRVNDI